MTKIDINCRTSALLILHYQINMINKLPLEERAKLLDNMAKVINVARKHTMPIIYVIAQFRKGYPEVSPRNPSYYKKKENMVLTEGNPEVEICSEVRPQPAELVIINKRSSAFTGNDLDIILRSMNIDTLILSGVSTTGVVESTARQAFDMDYQLFVLGDCYADRIAGANDVVCKWVMPKVSTVCTSDDLVSAITEDKE